MFRLLGFLTGAALVMAAMLMVAGRPERSADPPPVSVDQQSAGHAPIEIEGPVEEAAHAAVEAAPFSASVDAAAGTAAPDAPVAAAPESGAIQRPSRTIGQLAHFEPDPDSGYEAVSSAAQPAGEESAEVTEHEFDDPAAPGDEGRWHSLWSPFRSQIAAEGFAARLATITGIEYRVVQLNAGAYQVTFAYADDGDRAAKIAQIEGVTGLDLSEPVP